jgi:hypothetical protein
MGEVAAPAPATSFLRAVADISHQARAQEAQERAPENQNNSQPQEKPQDENQNQK